MEWMYEDSVLQIGRLITPPLENNVYVVACARTGEAVIIDAAGDADRILEAVDELTTLSVLTTHGHHDHIGAALEVTSTLAVPFRLHPADTTISGMTTTQPLTDNEEITVGGLTMTVLHTPGHTPGSTCFRIGSHLFSGDTLFPGGPGATRFPYSSFEMIMDSLEQRLFAMTDETSVYPGHGNPTTLGTERPFLQEWRSRGW